MSKKQTILDSPSINRIEQDHTVEGNGTQTDDQFRHEAANTFFNSVLDPHGYKNGSNGTDTVPEIKKVKQPPVEAVSLKLQTTPESVRFEERLPERYGSTYVTLIAKDPHCIYAYWEINGEDIQRIKTGREEAIDRGTYTLRIYDVTLLDFNGTNANYWFDLDELHMNNRYVPVPADDAVYCAEIGVRLADGQFIAVARSNCVATPRGHVSARHDLIWKEINRANNQTTVYVNVKYLNRKLRAKLSPRANWQMDTSRRTLNSSDIALYYTHKTKLAQQLMKKMQAAAYNLAEQYIAVEGSLIPALMHETYRQRKAAGASEEFLWKEKQEAFPFELVMELSVRGKTEPGAEVRLGDKPVKLEEDGSFTMKWNLQDGYMPLHFSALSKQKNLGKSISTSVLRSPTERNDFRI